MKLVLDTNIVLDLYVFRDGAVAALQAAIVNGDVEWLATAPMREELACVLAYELIGARMQAAQVTAQQVLADFDARARIVEVPAISKATCRDPDDQKFVDLAAAHDATLLSKDKQVLALRRKLAVAKTFTAPPLR